MKDNKIKWLMRTAECLSQLSSCLSRKVGCILVDEHGYVVATGYNGPPAKMGECTCCNRVSGQDLEQCPAVHAEMNALLQCADVQSIVYLFVTTKPCRHCIKMLLNTSCEHIYYIEEYPHGGVQELWESAGRQMEQIACT